jgi:hypothetical protein
MKRISRIWWESSSLPTNGRNGDCAGGEVVLLARRDIACLLRADSPERVFSVDLKDRPDGKCMPLGILLAATALHPQSKSNAEFRPEIPKAWEDAEVATMEIPLAPPAPRTTNISESYYYSIPPVTIYKSYPLVSADKPFA